MANDSFKIKRSLNIEPIAGSAPTAEGDIAYDSTAHKASIHNGTTASPVVTEAHTQTLTNKTIDADSNTITNIENADIKSGAAIARNKLASGTASHVIINDGSGIMSSEASLAISRGGTGQATKAAAFDALHPMTTTGDMIYSSSGSTSARLAVGSSGQVIKSVGGVPTWATFSGGINYINSNPDAEADTTGWTTYADAAAVAPVDGTGGSPNTTWTRTTSSPLRGIGSFLWTKSAGASRQGEGVAFPFTIDSADQAKALAITFDYLVVSGTFTASDGITTPANSGAATAGNSTIGVFIYDVTNSALIPVTPSVLTSNNTTIASTYKGTFQTSSNSTSYRLILHTSYTTDAAMTAKFDNFFVGPQSASYGPPVTDWTEYSLTIGATTSAPTKGTTVRDKARWRRVGDSMEISYDYEQSAAGANGTGTYLFPLPSGYTIDTSKLSAPTDVTKFPVVGSALSWTDEGADFSFVGTVAAYDSSNLFIAGNYSAVAGSNSTFDTIGSIFKLGNGSKIVLSFIAKVPISGWSSSVLMSNDTDTRIVAASYYVSANTAFNTTTINFDTKDYDTHSAVTTGVGTWKFTAPVSGIYDVYVSQSAASGSASLTLYKNGSAYAGLATINTTNNIPSSTAIKLVAGDYIDLRTGGTVTLSGGTGANNFTNVQIARRSGHSSIATTETVAASYYKSSNNTENILNVDTKIYDTHSAVTTGANWKFTVPVSGLYSIKAFLPSNTGATDDIQLYKNGAFYKDFANSGTTNVNAVYLHGNTTVRLVAGDYIYLRAVTGPTFLGGSLAGTVCWVDIERVGN